MSKSEEKKLSNWINNALVLSIFTGILIGVPGYFGKSYFDSLSKKDDQTQQYKNDTYKKLYEKSKPEIIALHKSKNELFSLLQNHYAISTFEIEKPLLNFKKAIISYDGYVSELEFYGNSNQIKSAKQIQEWSYEAYYQFSDQLELAKKVQRSMHDMIIGSYQDPAPQNPEGYIKFHLDKIQNELDKMIQGENKLYYEYRNFDIPVFKLLSDQLIYNFRDPIGLGMTSEIAESYKIVSKIDQLKENSKYQDSQIPYVVAESRSFLSNDFSANNDVLLKQKNSLLKVEILGKLMNYVSENDPYIKKKKRKI